MSGNSQPLISGGRLCRRSKGGEQNRLKSKDPDSNEIVPNVLPLFKP